MGPLPIFAAVFRRAAACMFLMVATAAGPAGATGASTDQSDLWWNASESGWGIQLVQ